MPRREGRSSPAAYLAAAVAALLAACMASPRPGPEAIATIGLDEVSWSSFAAYLEDAGGEMALALSSEASSRLLDQFLDEELLRREAALRGLPSADHRAAVAALLDIEVGEAEPGEEEVLAHYRSHAREFTRPETVRLRQILTAQREFLEQALEELAQGQDFPAVARRWSLDPGRERGGDQGWVAVDDLPPAFAAAIEDLPPGTVTPILETGHGFHLLQVVERRPAGRLPLAVVRPEEVDGLRRQRRREVLAALVAEARDRYNVRVVEQHLPFAYDGSYP